MTFGAETHFVKVTKLEPASAVSIIDTELEVDIFIPGFIVSSLNVPDGS